MSKIQFNESCPGFCSIFAVVISLSVDEMTIVDVANSGEVTG